MIVLVHVHITDLNVKKYIPAMGYEPMNQRYALNMENVLEWIHVNVKLDGLNNTVKHQFVSM